MAVLAIRQGGHRVQPMKRFSFGTYIVDDANREALAICQDMASLRTVEPQPTLILADRGCGKTHLLYSIVNRRRSGSAPTGIAYVTARDFPEEVRVVIEDPSRVERAEAAVLLVDQLEGFEAHLDELEAVTRIFLDNNHQVLFASSVHPERLGNLSEGLKSILAQGRIVEIHPRNPEAQKRLEAEIVSHQVWINAITEDRDEAHRAIDALRADLEKKKNNQAELEDVMTAASEEIERLRNAAAQTPPGPSPAETAEAEALRVRLAEEAERACADSHDLREALDQSQSEYQTVSAQLKREQEQLRVKSEEVDALRREALDKGAAANASGVQLHNTRDELHRLQEALATARSDYDALAAQSERASQETAANAAKTAANAAALAQKTTELEALRAEAAEQEASAKARAFEFESRITTFTAELNLLNKTAARALEERDDLRERLRHTDENRAESTAQAETVRAESSRSREALEQARTELQQVAKQLRQAQEELDVLRRDTAGQVAAAYSQAGEFEHKLSAFSAEIERLRDTAPNVTLEKEHLRDELQLADQARNSLAGQLDDARVQSEQLRKALESAQVEQKALSDELTQTQEELNRRDEEVGDLRRQATEQLATSKGRADELGDKLAQVNSELELTRKTNRAVASEWQSLQSRLSEDANAAGALAAQFSMARGGREAESILQAGEPGEIAQNGQGAAADKTSLDEETGQTPPASSPSAADLMGSFEAERNVPADDALRSEEVLEPLEPLRRPDFGPEFGQEIQFSSSDSSSLHHVEELEDGLGVDPPDSDPFRDLAEEES